MIDRLANGCLAKRAYKGKAEAEDAINAVKKRLSHEKIANPRGKMRAYRCDFCEMFHIGHVGERRR